MTDFGEVLMTARRASGMTQEELAAKAGITQAALSRWENGLRAPDSESLELLAHELGVTTRFVEHAGKARAAMAVDAHMRRRASAPVSTWRRLEARLNMFRMHASLLSEEVSIRSEHRIPTFDPVDTPPESAARLVRAQWGVPIGPVRQLVGWIEAAGCLVIEESFPTNRVDGLSQWVDGQPLIYLNSEAPTDRKRLTLAHELGHLVMHASESVEEAELQANAFAAEFLMPVEAIRPQLRNLRFDRLLDLKGQWGVSMAAIIERAFHIGLLTTQQRARFYKMLSVRGWRTREPLSEDLPSETPRLVDEIYQALRARGLSESELADIAGFASPEVNRLFRPRGLRVV